VAAAVTVMREGRRASERAIVLVLALTTQESSVRGRGSFGFGRVRVQDVCACTTDAHTQVDHRNKRGIELSDALPKAGLRRISEVR